MFIDSEVMAAGTKPDIIILKNRFKLGNLHMIKILLMIQGVKKLLKTFVRH